MDHLIVYVVTYAFFDTFGDFQHARVEDVFFERKDAEEAKERLEACACVGYRNIRISAQEVL